MPKLHQIWPGVFIYTPAKNEVNQIRDSQDMPRTSRQTHRWILCFTVKYISVYKYLSKRQYLKSWESFVYPFLAVRVIAQTLSVCCIKDQVVLTHMQQNKKKGNGKHSHLTVAHRNAGVYLNKLQGRWLTPASPDVAQ